MKLGASRRRAWARGTNAVVATLLMLGILVLVAVIAQRYTWRLDLTESGSFTLSEETRNVLKTIDQPVKLKAFFAPASPESGKARDLFETYQYTNRKIEFEFIDPVSRPEVAREYNVETFGTVVAEGYGKRQIVQMADEESLTNAILKLTRTEQKKIYFLTGHGEGDPDSTAHDGYSNAKAAMERRNYIVAKLNFAEHQEVPEDAAIVVVNGPRKPLLDAEIERLESFLDRGGRLMVFLDPGQDAGFSDFLMSYGIELGQDIVKDPRNRLLGASEYVPIANQYGHHRITERLEFMTYYPEARSVQSAGETSEGVDVQVLVSSSPNAVAQEYHLEAGDKAAVGSETTPGPVHLAVIARIDRAEIPEDGEGNPEKADQDSSRDSDGPESAYLLVVGDSDFINNTNISPAGNGDLFLNMVNFLAEEENLITVEPRQRTGVPKVLSINQQRAVFWTSLGVVPLIVLISGVLMLRFRRKHR